MCGHLAVRSHASFQACRGAVVWAFISSPTRPSPLPHPKLSLAMCFAGYMATALFVSMSRWQLSFYPEHVIVAMSVL